MGKYAYQAIDRSGAAFAGEIEGDSARAAAAAIRQRGWYVTKLAEVQASRPIRLPEMNRVKNREIVLLCRQLAAMLSAGVPLVETIKILQQQMGRSALQKALAEVFLHVQSGKTLSESMRLPQDIFPASMVYLIAAGEASGTLDVVLNRLAIYLERDYKATEKLKSAMAYPLLLLAMTVLLVGFILCFVMPVFVNMFATLQATLPLPTQILLRLSSFASSYWWAGLLLFAGFWFGCSKMYRLPRYKCWLDSILLKVPVLGELVYKTTAMRISSTLAVLLGSGMAIDEAVAVAKDTVANDCFVKAMQQAQQDLRRGYSLSQSLMQGGLFEPMFLQLLVVGENTGELDAMLQKITDFYEIDVSVLSERIGTLMEPVMILVMGIIVGAVVISIALPMIDAVTAGY